MATDRRPIRVCGSILATAIACVAAEDLDRQVERAIDRGTEFLLTVLRGGDFVGPGGKIVGTWTSVPDYPMGSAAIQVYALVKSDIPYSNPTVAEGLRRLAALPLQKTYCVSLYVMALDAVLSQMDIDESLGGKPDPKLRASFVDRLEQGAQWLVRARWKGHGAWNYLVFDTASNRFDHSNTQFAILALGVAHKRRAKIPPEVWEEIAAHFIDLQQEQGPEVKPRWGLKEAEPEAAPEKGKTKTKKAAQKAHWGKEEEKVFARGWNYGDPPRRDQATFNMTCAGASSVLIAFDALRNRKDYPQDKRDRLAKSVRDGVGWLMATTSGSANWSWGGLGGSFYSLYSLEKVGDIGGIEKFGDFDWYDAGARYLLSNQDQRFGSWGTNDKPGDINYMTSLALLFLARATDLAFKNRPLLRPLLTGKGSGAKAVESSSRDWVYLEEYKCEVPVRRLLRKVRYFPTRKLLRMTEAVVKAYSPEHKPELIVTLLETRAKTPYDAVKKAMDEGLKSITGFVSDDPKAYQEFVAQWVEVLKAGKERDAKRIPKLMEYLRQTQSPALRLRVIWALTVSGAREAIGDLIEFMGSSDFETRRRAHDAVKFLSGQNLPFDPAGSQALRDGQLAAWREWFAQQKKAGTP